MVLKKMGPGGADWSSSCFLPFDSLSRIVKIFERIVKGRIRNILQFPAVSVACGFVGGAIDAIHAARLLVKKVSEKQKPVRIAAFNLENAFDCVLRGAMRPATSWSL